MIRVGEPPAQHSLSPEAPGEIDVPAGWLRLALQAGEPAFYDQLLSTVIGRSGAVSAGVWLVVSTAEGTALSCKATRGIPQNDPVCNAWLGRSVRALIAARKPLTLPAGPDQPLAHPCILVPMVWEGAGLGVLLLSGPDLSVENTVRQGKLAGWATRLHLRKPGAPADELDQGVAGALLASAHSADWPGILASHMAKKSGAWRVSLLREEKGQWRMVAVSGVGEIKRRTAESRAIEQEFARLGASASAADGSGPGGRPALAWRFEKAPGWGVLLEFEKGAAVDPVQVRKNLAMTLQISERVLPQIHGPGWRLSLSRALVDRQRAASPRGSRWALGAAAVAFLGACYLPVTETFEGNCELQPAQRFTVVAEVEGRIQSIAAREGALVAAGQTLAELDVSALKTRLEVARELGMDQEAQARRFQGLQDMTGYRLAKLKAEQHAQEASSLTEDIRHSTIVAPIQGKVLTKDLAQKQGTVLRLGDTFCEVGGLGAWNLQVALPEEDLDYLLRALEDRKTLPVVYRLRAGSNTALAAEVTAVGQVSEMAYPVDGKNVIYVTVSGVAIPLELLRDLRPGFSGRAAIEGRRRPWGLILTRRLLQYLRLHWWL